VLRTRSYEGNLFKVDLVDIFVFQTIRITSLRIVILSIQLQ
jgi:hypothetical protein